jgi:hypothetical protein
MGIGPVSKDAWKLVRATPVKGGPEGPKKNAMQSRLARGVGTWNSRLSGACRRSHTWVTATVLLSGTAKDPWQELHGSEASGPFSFEAVKRVQENRHARRHFQAAAHNRTDPLFSASAAPYGTYKLDWKARDCDHSVGRSRQVRRRTCILAAHRILNKRWERKRGKTCFVNCPRSEYSRVVRSQPPEETVSCVFWPPGPAT